MRPVSLLERALMDTRRVHDCEKSDTLSTGR